MKTTEGYAAVTPEGEFLRISETHTHTGHHIYLKTVIDIDDATIWKTPSAGYKGDRELPHGTKWVPVMVRREVLLRDWGISQTKKD